MAALEKVASQDDGPIASINIIPFVDIVLVLLVIFIVTSAAIVRASLNVELPHAASAGAKVASTLNLVLDKARNAGAGRSADHAGRRAGRAEGRRRAQPGRAGCHRRRPRRRLRQGHGGHRPREGRRCRRLRAGRRARPGRCPVTESLGRRGAGSHVRLVRNAAPVCAPIRPGAGSTRARRKQRRARRVRATPLAPETAAAARASLTGSGGRSRFAGSAVWALALAAHAAVAFAVWRTRPAPPVARTATRITVQVHEAASPPQPSPRAIAAAPVRPARPAAPRAPAVRLSRATRAAGRGTPGAGEGGRPLTRVDVGGGARSGVRRRRHAGWHHRCNRRRPTNGAARRPSGPTALLRVSPRPGSVLTPPRRLNEVKPRYPDARRAAGVEADVLLVVSLDAAGRVLSVTVGRSSGDDAFDESARAAARQERFSPALRDGVPVPTTFTFTTHFRLDMP